MNEKFKYDGLKKVIDKLEKHSKKGDVTLSFDSRTNSLIFVYNSNVDTDTTIEIYPADLAKFVCISEKKWLA